MVVQCYQLTKIHQFNNRMYTFFSFFRFFQRFYRLELHWAHQKNSFFNNLQVSNFFAGERQQILWKNSAPKLFRRNLTHFIVCKQGHHEKTNDFWARKRRNSTRRTNEKCSSNFKVQTFEMMRFFYWKTSKSNFIRVPKNLKNVGQNLVRSSPVVKLSFHITVFLFEYEKQKLKSRNAI